MEVCFWSKNFLFKRLYLICFNIFFLVFSWYCYFYAQSSDIFAFKMIFFLFLISSYRFFLFKININKIFIFISATFLYLLILSNVFPPSIHVKLAYTLHSLSFLFLSFFILLSFMEVSFFENEKIFIIIYISIFLLSFFSIASHYYPVDKGIFNIFKNISVVESKWNNKYFCYWLVFLTWASAALNSGGGLFKNFFSYFLIFLCGWTVFLTDAESAQLAVVISLFFFVVLSFKENRYRKFFLSIPFVLFFAVPIFWIFISPVMEILKNYGYLHDIIASIDGIYLRVQLYDGAADLIRKNILTGYGFGSGYNVPVDTAVCAFGGGRLPGGHPHNIVFMSLLEQGVFGFCWLVAVMFLLFDFTCKNFLNRQEFAAFSALIVSAMIIFSFSFDVWNGDVILLYVMLAVLMRTIVGSSVSYSDADALSVTCRSKNVFLAIMVGGTITYLLNFIFYSGQMKL